MRFVELTVLPIAWGSILLVALSLHDTDALNQNSICGVWGCGPPTSALVAIHLGWLVALWPPMFYLPWRLKTASDTNSRIAIALIASGTAGVAGIILWQWLVWLPNASQHAAIYIWQRCAFAVVTAGDWPFVQLLLGGFVLSVAQRLFVSRPEGVSSTSNPTVALSVE